MSTTNEHQNNSGWYTVSATQIGKSHIENGTVCQDSHNVMDLGDGWYFAIVCDGAGSAKHSEKGSDYVSKKLAPDLFINYLEENKLKLTNVLPNEDDWKFFCQKAYAQIYLELCDHAQKLEIQTKDLACTMIAAIIAPKGILITHIGDGRAGYKDQKGIWNPIITPHKGEEANQTVFLTSMPWDLEKPLEMSGVSVPESRVINDEIAAFTLLSDGCENHSFLCSIMDEENQKWTDPNQPYDKFFNPIIKTLVEMKEKGTSVDEANMMWGKFLDQGTKGLANEPDDKTLILGITDKLL